MDLETLTRRLGPDVLARPRVAVDAMGGDHAPEEVVRGAVDWARLHPDVDVILVGDEPRIRPFIDAPLPAHVTIVQASETVGMDEAAATSVRRKRDASINVCMRLVREGRADAVVTAGHTGAGVASAILHLGRLPGVDRPALAIQMVTDRGPFVLLDIGATTDANGRNLAQYARMAALYAERVLGVEDPSVALLSIGEERGKGDLRVQEATTLLESMDLRFIGNVEGRDLPRHPADVVVCDASVGNVVDEVLRGPLERHVRDAPAGVPAAALGSHRLLLHAPGPRPHPPPVRLRATRRIAPAGRERNRAHHPRPRQAAHDRVRRRGRRRRGTCADPGEHRRRARRGWPGASRGRCRERPIRWTLPPAPGGDA